jgi:hypothetical protein
MASDHATAAITGCWSGQAASAGVAVGLPKILGTVFDEDGLERGLERLLDGIALDVERRQVPNRDR